MSKVDYSEEQKRKELKKDYAEVVNRYVDYFMKKQDISCFDWVNDDLGGVVLCGDFYVDFNDMKTDIDLNAPKGLYFEWYDKSYVASMEDKNFPNYTNYVLFNRG